MPATETELNQIFTRVAAVLREVKLDWLLEQVISQINAGKPIATKVKELRDQTRSRTRRGSGDELLTLGSVREFRTTVQYTAREKVALLLCAVEQLLVVLPTMQDSVAKHFPQARFVSPDGDLIVTERTAIEVDSSEKFKSLIEALRQEAGVNGNQ